MTIPMCYYYKGSTNCYLRLEENFTDGTISIITGYGEVIAVVNSGHELVRVLKDIDDDKYTY